MTERRTTKRATRVVRGARATRGARTNGKAAPPAARARARRTANGDAKPAVARATTRRAPAHVFPLRAAAALFIERQHLERPRAQRLTAASLGRFVEDVGGIQLDSINVIDRAHYLTAWSRFGPYDRATLDRLVYRRRVLFEYWAHAACLVPTSQLASWRRAMMEYQSQHTGWAKWLKTNAKTMRVVENAIRARGPLGNADFQQVRPPGAKGWWSWKPATYGLHFLWMTGRILIHSRKHFHKRFDLAERVAPAIASCEPPSVEEFQRWHLTRSLHAMGAATDADLRSYMTFPRGNWRRAAIQRLLASGEAVEIGIEGTSGRWLALAADLPALEKAARRRAPAQGTTLLAPFDSLLWYRDRAKKLFGFDYRIEVYTPGHKRVHGYYSLPIFHDGHLIGRLDAKNHREARRLEALHAHFEPWLAAGGTPPAASWGTVDVDRAMAGVAEALGSLAAFLGSERVDLARVTPAKLRVPLARALRDSAVAVDAVATPE